jgi:EAL domain-containing protein (putative c-di-GMP-specific phosphodiesterase class I)
LTFFNNEIMIHKTRMLELTEMLRDSVEHNYRDFSLNYQPQIDASTGSINGTEVLLRWSTDKYGALSPVEFIPLLEKSALIHPVGRWVFRSAIETCKQWIDELKDFTVNINMSYLQLIHPDFVRFVMDTIQAYNIMPKNVVLEITEHFIESSATAMTDALLRLREMGIRIAMDDFGTGYSSLNILKMNPADIVKIDRVFVSNLRNSKFDATFIRFIVALCHEMNIKVCLEGVESLDDYSIVQPMELDMIQGYLFGYPLCPEDFQALMQASAKKES